MLYCTPYVIFDIFSIFRTKNMYKLKKQSKMNKRSAGFFFNLINKAQTPKYGMNCKNIIYLFIHSFIQNILENFPHVNILFIFVFSISKCLFRCHCNLRKLICENGSDLLNIVSQNVFSIFLNTSKFFNKTATMLKY